MFASDQAHIAIPFINLKINCNVKKNLFFSNGDRMPGTGQRTRLN